MFTSGYKMSEKEYDMLKQLLEIKKTKKKTAKLEKLRCAIYARKSQPDEKDTSLDTQINFCKEIIESVDLLQLDSIYQEDNTSGMWDDREQFQDLISDIQLGRIDVVVVYAWDRFSRKSADLFNYREFVINAGAYIIAGDESTVIDSAATYLSFQVKGILSENYARTSADRTYLALRNIVKNQGRYVSGSAPYGYDKTADGKLDINIDESIVVNLIFDKILAGYSIGQVVNLLNSQGHKTKKGNLFTKGAVHKIATNQIYIGKYIFDKLDSKKKRRVAITKMDPIVVEDAFPAIVSQSIFEEVQKLLESRSQSRVNNSGHIYLLSGLVKCKNCGKTMIGESHKGR